jgi:hypothetical protein
MSTTEKRADELAAAFVAAEKATEILTNKMRAFTQDATGIGPINRLAFIRQCQGVQGDIARLHVEIKAFDPRPQPFDGGGGK